MPSVGHNRGVETPVQEARSVSAAWRESVASLLDACDRIYRVLDAFEQDEARQTQFIAGLVKGGVLTAREGKHGLASPKLSKLKTIGQYADVLRRKEISESLTPEYSVLYQLCVLYKKIPNEDAAMKIQKLERIVSACSGELSRDYLATQAKRLKRSKPSRKSTDDLNAGNATTLKAATLSNLISRERAFDLLLLTPTKIDMSLLRSDYEKNALEMCFPLFKIIDHSEPTGLVIIASVSDLATIATKLLPLCGFSDMSHVVLTNEPKSADIIDSSTVIIAVKGAKLKALLPRNGGWFDVPSGRIGHADAIKIAESIFPSQQQRLHVFAERATDRWQSLIGDTCWIELPSIK